MKETNGEVYSIRKDSKPIAPDNLTAGSPSQSYYYGLTGEILEPVSPQRQRLGPTKGR